MNCKKIQTILFEYLEGELPDRKQDEILTHINQCQQCCNELKAWENLRHKLKSDILLSPTPGYWESLAKKTLSGLAKNPKPLFILRPAWGAGFVLAGILMLILNFYWFSAVPVKRIAQTRVDEVWNEVMKVKHIAFGELIDLSTAELKELINELSDDYEETRVGISNNSNYPRNAYHENILELNNKEMKMMLNDQIFVQQASSRR
jgi:hypothetical protein